MSLINGMDSIMTHIKNQEILIKKLKEQNKQQQVNIVNEVVIKEKLQIENDKLNKIQKSLHNTINDLENDCTTLEFKNEKLKVENDRLNNLKHRVDNFKQKLKDTVDLEDDDEGWMETWDIIEDTLGIDTRGNDIA